MLFVSDYLQDQTILRSPNASMSPIVSVILPTYARYQNGLLQRAVNSVLTQTLNNLELIVVDDGSTDGTKEYIEKLRHQDARVVHIRHEINSGLPGLRVNEGIEIAQGKYIAFQFDDDVWRPNALHWLVTAAGLQANDAVMVGQTLFRWDGQEAVAPLAELTLTNLYRQNWIANNSVLIPKHLFDLVGMYDCHLSMRRICDWDLWLRLIKYVPFVIVQDVVADVWSGQPDSVGATMPYDITLIRFVHDIDRNNLLTPAKWRMYSVDTNTINNVTLPSTLASTYFNEQVIPYYARFRHDYSKLARFSPSYSPKSKTVLYARNAYDFNNEKYYRNYDSIAARRGNYKSYFRWLSEINPSWVNEADGLLLFNSSDIDSIRLIHQANAGDRAVAYLFDHNLTLENGKRSAKLDDIVRNVDTVWVANETSRRHILPYNTRVVPYHLAIDTDLIPPEITPIDLSDHVRIAVIGNMLADSRLTFFWSALERIHEEYEGNVKFELWFVDPKSMPPLNASYTHIPLSEGYYANMSMLKQRHYALVLVPELPSHVDDSRSELWNYYQTMVAGAVGVFSDVPQFEPLQADATCLKATNSTEGWYAVVCKAMMMTSSELEQFRRACVEDIRNSYTTTMLIDSYEAAWRATDFHRQTRHFRHGDGRPRIVYVFHSPYLGGAEIILWRQLELALAYGIEPIVVMPANSRDLDAIITVEAMVAERGITLEFLEYQFYTVPVESRTVVTEEQLNAVLAFLEHNRPALVHSNTFVPMFGQACQMLSIPHVAQLFQIPQEAETSGQLLVTSTHCDAVMSDSIRYAHRWADLLQVRGFCSRSPIPNKFFQLGKTRQKAAPLPQSKTIRITVLGTIQSRKGQLEAITSVGELLREGFDIELNLYGYNSFFSEYVEYCLQQAQIDNSGHRIKLHDFDHNVEDILRETDVLLVSSVSRDAESFPNAIKEAMAAGVLVVTTPVGGVTEIVFDHKTGVLCKGFSVEDITDGIRRALDLSVKEQMTITERASCIAHEEFHEHRASNDLFSVYNYAVQRKMMVSNSASVVQAERQTTFQPSHVVDHLNQTPSPFPVRLHRRAFYSFRPKQGGLSGIDFLIGTHYRVAEGIARLKVFANNGVLLRQVETALNQVGDNDWLAFRFEQIANANQTSFTIELSLLKVGKGTQISVYERTQNPMNSIVQKALYISGLTAIKLSAILCRLHYQE